MNNRIPSRDLCNNDAIMHEATNYYCCPELMTIEYRTEYINHCIIRQRHPRLLNERRWNLPLPLPTNPDPNQDPTQDHNNILYNKPNVILYIEPSQYTETMFNCCICYEELKKSSLVKFKCNHELCKDCCKQIINKTKESSQCPLCRDIITELKINNSIVAIEMTNFVN
jgi:hypothetical protein